MNKFVRMIKDIETQCLSKSKEPILHPTKIQDYVECRVFKINGSSKFGIEWTVYFCDEDENIIYFELLETRCVFEFTSCDLTELDKVMDRDYSDLKRTITITSLDITLRLQDIHESLILEIGVESLTIKVFKKIIDFYYCK